MTDQVLKQNEQSLLSDDASSTSLEPHKGRKILGIPLGAILETLIFYGVLLLIDLVFLDGNRFWGVSPHPFWLPVLVLTMHYGTNAGIISATLGTVFLLVGNVPAQTMEQDLYAYVGSIVVQPILWFLAALILGELRMRHIRERDQLRAQVKDLEDKAQTIGDAYNRLHGVKMGLEHRIATQMKSVVSLYDAAKAIENLNDKDVYQSIGQIVKNIVNPDKFSIFLEDGKENNKFSLVSQEGWAEGDNFLTSFDATTAFYKSMVADQQVLCVSNADQQKILNNQGVMAGPLYDKDQGRVIGFIKVEQLPFMDLTFSTIENFKILCEWLGMSISKAKRIEKIEGDSYLNPSRNLLSGGFMDYLQNFLATLGKRLEFEIATITISPAKDEGVTSDQLVSLSSVISDSVDSVLRSIDLAFDCQKMQKNFVVILPATSVEGANMVVEKLTAVITPKLTPQLKEIGLRYAVQKLS